MRPNKKSGFTLLEVVIYTAMVAIIMLGVIMLAVVTLDVRGKVRASIVLGENYRFAMNRITTLVNQAQDISSPGLGAVSDELILQMGEPALSPTVISNQNGVIFVQQGAGQPMALTSEEVDVLDFKVERANTTLPMVRVVMFGEVRGAAPSYPDLTVTTTAVIRK